MKTTEKDVLKICKGWYDKEKYNNEMEALKAYQVRECGLEFRDISAKDVMDFALLSAAKEFFKTSDWAYFFKEGLLDDIDWHNFFKKDGSIDFNYEYLCKKLIVYLSLLKVKENDKWIIDFSDYDDNIII